jgi:hypothetical protein
MVTEQVHRASTTDVLYLFQIFDHLESTGVLCLFDQLFNKTSISRPQPKEIEKKSRPLCDAKKNQYHLSSDNDINQILSNQSETDIISNWR